MFLLMIIFLNSAAVLGPYAEFSFDDKVFKSSPIKEGELLHHTFYFTNTGELPLVISNYEVACACTKVAYPKTPVAPGSRDSIVVDFDSEGKMGWQYRKIQLFANTKKSPEVIEFRVRVD